jgi:hypothetical protein
MDHIGPRRRDAGSGLLLTFCLMGDPACFLSATCLSCGRFIGDEDADDELCPHCGKSRLGEAPKPPPTPPN